ncbi:MAG: prolyl aminopeptidase [Aerococcaceae bacterium]|nr:prolyl aminopeptidase [Aerococcaceae bacterium]
MKGYIDTPINQTYYIEVSDNHTLYVEECGNPNGKPVIFLHGGPGGSISELSRRFFDPSFYRIILFDQRGCGKSQPFLSLVNNTPLASVADMEVIRQRLGIAQWIVFGGSYGSTLALAYAIHHPDCVAQLVLRGIFLGRQQDIDWLFQAGASYFYPEEFELFKGHIAKHAQMNLVHAYYQQMLSDNLNVRNAACKKWSNWESSIVTLMPTAPSEEVTAADLSIGLLEAHYFANKMFWNEDNYLINRANKLKEIPIAIFHGRYDVDCRLSGAYDLKKACPHAKLHIVEASGHSIADEPLFDALLQFMEQLKI